VWDAGGTHRLVGVVDGAANRVEMVWTDTGVEVLSPARSDGVVAKTVLKVGGGRFISVTNSAEDTITFAYNTDEYAGLLEDVRTKSGAVTHVSYQRLTDTSVAVDQVKVLDSITGRELSSREWDVIGEHTPSGWPTYPNHNTLWQSGDDQYRYQTQLSDGATRVALEYNSLGLMVDRQVTVSTPAGDTTVQQQQFTYLGTEDGGVPDPQTLPKQYAKPTQTTVVSRDDKGHTRAVTEKMAFDDAGRVTKHVAVDGAVTKTVYDEQVPHGMVLPVGLMVEQTTTGTDDTIAKTVNTLTPDRKTIQTTQTLTGTSVDTLASTSRTEFMSEPDGFVSEERVSATGDGLAEGPETVVTQYARAVNEGAGTLTLSQTTAAETPAASTVSTTIDKTTGLALHTIDPVGRITSTTYDTAGRVATETGPTGLQMVTAYGDKGLLKVWLSSSCGDWSSLEG
jgi:YD repeat-containing protein